MRFFAGIFIFLFVFVLSSGLYAKDERPKYKSVYEIPRFIKLEDEGISRAQFMKLVLADLQRPLLNSPRSVQFLNKDNEITREALEKYKKQAVKQLAKNQKRNIVKFNTEPDKFVTFSEYMGQGGYEESDVLALYNSVKEYGWGAADKHAPILHKMEKTPQKKITPLTFFKETLRTFIELDQNSDQKLSMDEINTPTQRALRQETADTVSRFEAYLALSTDGNKSTLDQVNAASEKAFNTLDMNANDQIDSSEFSFYLRARVSESTCDVPKFSSSTQNYAIGVYDSEATTSVQFSNMFEGFIGYVEVEIEKQNKPVNLVLGSVRNMVWSVKGDTQSLQNVVIFGPGEGAEITAGVIGVPQEKVSFSSRRECWDFGFPAGHRLEIDNEEIREKNKGLLKYLTGRYPDLLKIQSSASKFTVKTKGGIEFFNQIDDSLKQAPQGYNEEYWAKFLDWKAAGFKALDLQEIRAGSYATIGKVMPSWAGIAQLEHDGVIRPLHTDLKAGTAVFMLEKDLPGYPGTQNSNPPMFTFIKDKESIKFPNPIKNSLASRLCIMSREGGVLLGERYCSVSDLAFLKSDEGKPALVKNPIFISLPKYIVDLPANKDSIDIKLGMDEGACKKQYDDAYKQKCQIPQNLINKPIPDYAFTIEPSISGKLTWKDNSTLTFTPSQVWQAGELYILSIDLDNMGWPKGIYLNNERAAKANFYASYVFVEADNVIMADDPYDVNIKIVTGDLQSNYPLSDLRIDPIYVPKDAVQPDEHIFVGDKGYETFGARFEGRLHEFEMPDMKRSFKLYVYRREDGLEPTHLLIGEPQSAAYSEVMYSRPVWVDLQAGESAGLSPEVQKLEAKAKNGSSDAQLELGKIYFEGKLTQKSLSKARKWLLKAAAQENVQAYVQLGLLDLRQYSIEYNGDPESLYWFSQAAQYNNKVGQYGLGVIFSYYGTGYFDYEESKKWFELSAQQGYIPAINKLGLIYEYGKGVEIGYKKAMDIYKQAADQGDPEALARIARMYRLGRGVKRDLAKAYSYAKKSLSLSKRDDQVSHNIGSRIVAEYLMEEVRSVKSFDARVILIADRVFKEFSKDYVRMWIARAISNQWDGGNGMPRIAKEIVDRQARETPNLEEMRYMRSDIILSDNYYSEDQYEPNARNEAIRILESLLDNGYLLHKSYFNIRVINSLTYLYLSKKEPEKATEFLDRIRIGKHYTYEDLNEAYSKIQYYNGRITEEMKTSNDPDDRYNVARRHQETMQNAAATKQWYLDQIKQNPKRAWTYGNFSSFLLYTMGDYDGAIKYGEKALKLMNYPLGRYTTGMAYLVKASQLFKQKESIELVEKYIEKALSYGINSWYIKDNCNEFCGDIVNMVKAYNEHNAQEPI